MSEVQKNSPPASGGSLSEKYYRELLWKNFLRLALTYLVPLLLLTLYFWWQYRTIAHESQSLHLQSIAEHQANTLDLFLRERVVNLTNLIDDPKLPIPPSSLTMQSLLEHLIRSSDTFIDVGFFDDQGIQRAYAGPLPYLENRNYSLEPWWINLRQSEDHFVTTDVYLGFRQKPHFTIGVSRIMNDRYVVLRATLDPMRFYEYIHSLLGTSDVNISIVNRQGYYQLVTPQLGTPLQSSSLIPPAEPRLGVEKLSSGGPHLTYAYAWLHTADWAVVVQCAQPGIVTPLFAISSTRLKKL